MEFTTELVNLMIYTLISAVSAFLSAFNFSKKESTFNLITFLIFALVAMVMCIICMVSIFVSVK